MNKHMIWAWAIKNSLATIAWITLAVVFQTWWIALFGILFLSDLETKRQSYMICDGCGKHSPYADSHNEALDKAKEADWIHYAEDAKDYCPECRKEINK